MCFWPPTARTWKILSFVVAMPGVAVCMANAYMKMHAHSHDAPEFVPYAHLQLRTKVSGGLMGCDGSLYTFNVGVGITGYTPRYMIQIISR